MEIYKFVWMESCLKNTSSILEIMTCWIECQILNYADIGAKEQRYKIFQYLCEQSILRFSARWFFEIYTDDWLRKEESFEADRLSYKDSNKKLSFDIEYTRS